MNANFFLRNTLSRLAQKAGEQGNASPIPYSQDRSASVRNRNKPKRPNHQTQDRTARA
ncbi:hypothetical protein [Blastopirellula marina]|uniref:hypothetical protein n=1 Tax=Blastopirellula marina TaxID=124 RepID=UPI001304C9F5|nr:hypothetical protein [Blastopirellula marina]